MLLLVIINYFWLLNVISSYVIIGNFRLLYYKLLLVITCYIMTIGDYYMISYY